jgi:UDP-N-acetylglucosamine 2-epimerase (non-hydrolysing)
MNLISIHLIAAARPNFMKIAPLYHALKKEAWVNPIIVHTGQHYDLNMSDAFFHDLNLPEPHIHLGAGSGTHAEQTGKVMMAYEKVILEKKPNLVIVVGDVNSTLACTLAAVKIAYNSTNSTKPVRPLVAHLEAGLRSFDRSMPEEINRIATDALADFLWTPSPDGDENLLKEGISKEKIVLVGNIMIDSLEMLRSNIEKLKSYEEYGLKRGQYGVMTFHRPANVDNPDQLLRLCKALINISQKMPLIFPIHPRTRKNLKEFNLIDMLNTSKRIILAEPLHYIKFMNLIFNCRFAMTDSGGIQEETTYLGIPCITMRPNTERPITVTQGTNNLSTLESLESTVDELLFVRNRHHTIPHRWDGQTAQRVVNQIKAIFLLQA